MLNEENKSIKAIVKKELTTSDEDEHIQVVKIVSIPHNSGVKMEGTRKTKKSELILMYDPQEKQMNFFNKSEQKTETITNPKSKPYFIQIICKECPEATITRLYDNRPSFELHFKKAHQSPVRYSCSFCEYNIEKFQLFRAHFNKHMNSDRHRCTVCNETFSQKSDLKSHTTSMHNLRGCRKCDMKFDSLESLRQHKTIHAAEKSEKTECPDCGKILLTTGGYFTHRKMHQEKPKFICDCGKEFFQKVNFVNHQKTHSGTRNFRCEIDKCEAAFFEKSHLQRHLNFHSVSRDHQCQVCNKFYKTERCLKVHSLVHQSFRPFVCDICNKGFLSSSKLKQHSNIHTGLRPFKCKHCIRDFTNYPNLLKHTIRRHKVDHRTGEILLKIPDYVTNNKKKAQKNAVNQKVTEEELHYLPLISPQQEQVIQNVIEAIPHGDIILDDDLPSTSGLIRGFNLTDDSNDFDILDIDKEFDDFKILMSDNEQDEKYDEEPQFSISSQNDTLYFGIGDNSNQYQLINPNLIHHLSSSISSGQ